MVDVNVGCVILDVVDVDDLIGLHLLINFPTLSSAGSGVHCWRRGELL